MTLRWLIATPHILTLPSASARSGRGAARCGACTAAIAAPRLALISRIQAAPVILMVFAATAMARGFFH